MLTSNVEVTISPQTGSEQVPVGAHAQENRSAVDVERFLSLVRFDTREKVQDLVEKGRE